MSYAGVSDMVSRFGETEMVRVTNPEDHTATAPNAAKIELALADAASTIDGYLSKLYRTPIAAGDVPSSIVRAACVLARYDLAQGERTNPSEEMRLARKEVISWLESIAAGTVELPIPGLGGAGPMSGAGGARVSDRCRPFSDDALRGW